MSQNLMSIEFENAQGETVTLEKINAKAYLIVNVASKCGLTPHYEGLQALYEKYSGRGLEILGFPANEFLAQEPGTDEEIQTFCKTTYNVTFPVNKKIVVKGEGQHPLYAALTRAKTAAVTTPDSKFEAKMKESGLWTGEPHDIKWNFEKFLLNASGEVVERFQPDVKPQDSLITEKLEALLS